MCRIAWESDSLPSHPEHKHSCTLPRNQHPAPNAAYAPTKAMVHWLTKRINGEEETIAAFVVDPGYVELVVFSSSLLG